MVTFVVTTGQSALDIYAQKLAENLPISKVNINRSCGAHKLSKSPWNSLKIIERFLKDFQVIKTLNKSKEIFHLPHQHFGRYGNFLKNPFIITCHDIIRYFDLRGNTTFINKPNLIGRVFLELDFKGMKRAEKIIAVSNHTKKDLIQYLNIPEEKITVVYLGIDPKDFNTQKTQRIIANPYILYVGSEEPRKNLSALLKAFRKLKAGGRFRELKLVKVGKAGASWRENELRKKTMDIIQALQLENEVIFTEFVPQIKLMSYYSYAECLILPSLYEGFGLPTLEAMACGCPVIASNSSSLSEIVDNAGLKIDPHNINEIVEAIKEIINNNQLKKELRLKGLKRAKQFSWKKTVKETLEVYKEIENKLTI